MDRQWLALLLICWLCVGASGQSVALEVTKSAQRFEITLPGSSATVVEFLGLGNSDRYTIYLENNRSLESVTVAQLPAMAEQISTGLIEGVVEDRSVKLVLSNQHQYDQVASVIIRKNEQFTEKMGPIVTSSNSDLDFLLSTLFRFEDCFDRAGVRIVGEDRLLANGRRGAQTGTFSNGRSLIGIETGILLTTGFSYDAAGPNGLTPASGSFPGATPVVDADIQDLVGPGVPYFDAAILEFTFVPTTDSISFDYVFFSEEYCGSINSQFGQDAFAFILEGPEGRANIARLDDGSVISPFTLNPVKTPDLFVDNTPPGSLDDCAGGVIPPERLAGINYNGFSRRLTAKAKVTPCATYTLKFLVADAGDAQLDSGVFIEAGSLTTGILERPTVRLSAEGDLRFTEGCDSAFVTFTRLFQEPADLVAPLPVSLNSINTGGPLIYATEGLDYQLPTGSLVIPTGETSVTIAIPMIADGNDGEGLEAFILDYTGICNCDAQQDTIYIEDASRPTLTLSAEPGTCFGDPITVRASGEGGNPGYSYTWPDGLNGAERIIQLTGQDSLVTVIVSDRCGNMGQEQITLSQPEEIQRMQLSILGETCERAGSISVRYEGGSGDLRYAWSTGAVVPNISGVGAGDYRLSITDDLGCSTTETFTVTDLRTFPDATIGGADRALTCGQPSVQLTATASAPNTTYTWRNAAGDTVATAPTYTATVAGTYSLIARDTTNGCQGVSTAVVRQSNDVFTLNLPAAYALTCDSSSVTLGFTDAAPTGVDFQWSFAGAVVSTGPTVADVTQVGTYTLRATRQSDGCTTTVSTAVVDRSGPPIVTAPQRMLTLNCRAPQTELSAEGSGPFEYRWSTLNGQITGDTTGQTTQVAAAGNYTLTVKDTLTGCRTALDYVVVNDGATLTPQAGDDIDFNCAAAGARLSGTSVENLLGSVYRWINLAGQELGSTSEVVVGEPGTYVLETIHPASGCSSFDTIIVRDAGPREAVYTLGLSPCPEVGANLEVLSIEGGTGPYEYSSPTASTDPTGEGLVGLPAGTNQLIVTDALGCELVVPLQVFADQPFTGTAPDRTVRFGDTVRLGVNTSRDGQNLTYQWLNLPDTSACARCTQPLLRPFASFTAQVNVVDEDGCPLAVRQRIFVRERAFVYLPTAFSPADGNGVNDIYAVLGDAEFVRTVNSFSIYNRWGARVFQNGNFNLNDLTQGWNGRTEGGQLYPAGPYVYALEVELFDGRRQQMKGSFTLLR